MLMVLIFLVQEKQGGYYKSRAVKAIIEGFDEIKIALTEITNNSQDWSDETVAKADGLLQSLESFLFLLFA